MNKRFWYVMAIIAWALVGVLILVGCSSEGGFSSGSDTSTYNTCLDHGGSFHSDSNGPGYTCTLPTPPCPSPSPSTT